MKRLYNTVGLIAYPLLLPLMRYFLRRSNRVYVILVCNKDILLVKNWLARDTWRLPGGGVSRNETPISAAEREIKEELRIVLAKDRLVYVCKGKHNTDSLGFEYTIYMYRFDSRPRILPNSYEITHYCWQDINAQTTLSPEICEALQKARDMKLI